MIDIQVSRIGEHAPGIGVLLPSGNSRAFPGVERLEDPALGEQDSVRVVLAATICFNPSAVEAWIVVGGNWESVGPSGRPARQGLLGLFLRREVPSGELPRWQWNSPKLR